MTRAFVLLLALLAPRVEAGELLRVTTREGITTTMFWEAAQNPKATVLLFPGGSGGFGRVEDGRAQGGNFLVRSAPLFVEAGYNVAIFGRPSDMAELDYADRVGDAHLGDIAHVVAFVKSLSPQPVWLIPDV